jgi:hypothetical protein
MMWALEIIFADQSNATNMFRFARVQLNLPWHYNYNPKRLWVYKQKADGAIACDIKVCVDDMRTTGTSERECWTA